MKRMVSKDDMAIKGVCSFMYKGYEISSSNTCTRYWDTVVFDNDKWVYEAATVEDAIGWVNGTREQS